MAGRCASISSGCQRHQRPGLEGTQQLAAGRCERDSKHLGDSMQAVILAGGLGTRLWPLTKTVPKPKVPVAGDPYLEHQLRMLKKPTILDIVLLTGYFGEKVGE